MAAKGKSESKNKQQNANGSDAKANKSENGSAKKSDKSQSKSEKSEKQSSVKIPSIKSLTKILEGDLTTADPETALKQIQAWEAALKASDDKEIKAIAKEFKQLEKLVKEEASEAEFADLFVELGERVNNVADSAEEEIQEQLQEIGDALLGAADNLDTSEEEYLEDEEDIEEE